MEVSTCDEPLQVEQVIDFDFYLAVPLSGKATFICMSCVEPAVGHGDDQNQVSKIWHDTP